MTNISNSHPNIKPGKPLEREVYTFQQLSRLLTPESIAIVGASDTEHSFGSNTMKNLAATFKGQIYPVNPKRDTIHGLKSYPSIEDLPEVPDCVVLAIPGSAVIGIAETCAALGVGGVIIYSSGFAELGDEGAARQAQLTRIAYDSGMPILGPNCIGIANPGRGLGLTFMPSYRDMPQIAGDIGLVSQSGAMGYVVLQALQRGIGFSRYLTTGNAADVDVADLINVLVDDPDTKSIACMFEGVADPERLLFATKRALAAGKPVVVLKLGHSEMAGEAAKSHTGVLTGSYAGYRAAFEKTGVIVVDDFEALLETTIYLGRAGSPNAAGVAVLGASGGASILAVDLAADMKIEMPQPSTATRKKIEAAIPSFGYSGNPTDMTAESVRRNEMYTKTIEAFGADQKYGTIIVAMASAHPTVGHARAEGICETARATNVPVCIVWLNEWYQGPGTEIYDSSTDLTIFRSLRRCLNAIKAWHHYHERRALLLERLATSIQLPPLPDLGDATGTLSESQSKQILKHAGINVSRERVAQSVDDAIKFAEELGYPVVMKADSGDLPHKSELGVIRLNLADAKAVRTSWDEIMAAVEGVEPAPRLNGILVQEMCQGDIEVMVGVKRDSQFGPMVVCGLGGAMVELLNDVVVSLAPVSKEQAHEMIARLKGYKLLTGFRGRPAVDIDVFAEAICRISNLAVAGVDQISEIDVNPILLSSTGGIAVDALINIEPISSKPL